MNQVTAQMRETSQKIFVRRDPGWHVEVYRNAEGTAKIGRFAGIGCKPLCWNSPDLSPEEWVAIQDDANMYVRY